MPRCWEQSTIHNAAWRRQLSGSIAVGRNIDKRSNQAKQSLLFRLAASVAEEDAKLDVTELSSRRPVGLLNNESSAIFRRSAEIPAITAWTLVEFSPVRQ